MINPDSNGLVLCPNCKKKYKPILKRLGFESLLKQYPDSKPYEREQLISGLCSDKCWKEYLSLAGDIK